VVACRRTTWTRADHSVGHWLAALRPGAAVEVLARVETFSPELHGKPAASSMAGLGARAHVVAVGPHAEDLLRRAAGELGEKGAAAQSGAHKDGSGKLVIEQSIGPDGARELTVTMLPDASDLVGPRMIGPGMCLFLLVPLLGAGGWRAWMWALPIIALGIPLTYFWLAQLNRRTIRLGRDALSVEFSPFPWPGWRWPVSQVAGLATYDSDPPWASMASYHPDTLLAVRADGKRRALLRGASTHQVYVVRDFVKTALDLGDETVDA
jgi:hypothetical protein